MAFIEYLTCCLIYPNFCSMMGRMGSAPARRQPGPVLTGIRLELP